MQYVKHAVDFNANMQSNIFFLYIWYLYTIIPSFVLVMLTLLSHSVQLSCMCWFYCILCNYMQTAVWHQHINCIKVVVKSRNFDNVITLSKRREKNSILDKLCGGMNVMLDMNGFTISTVHYWREVISVMGSVNGAEVFHLDRRTCNVWNMEILWHVNIVALLYKST